MLTVLRNDEGGRIIINLNDFTIIYVAPLKALASEIVRRLSSRLAALHVNVGELTGDMRLIKV